MSIPRLTIAVMLGFASAARWPASNRTRSSSDCSVATPGNRRWVRRWEPNHPAISSAKKAPVFVEITPTASSSVPDGRSPRPRRRRAQRRRDSDVRPGSHADDLMTGDRFIKAPVQVVDPVQCLRSLVDHRLLRGLESSPAPVLCDHRPHATLSRIIITKTTKQHEGRAAERENSRSSISQTLNLKQVPNPKRPKHSGIDERTKLFGPFENLGFCFLGFVFCDLVLGRWGCGWKFHKLPSWFLRNDSSRKGRAR